MFKSHMKDKQRAIALLRSILSAQSNTVNQVYVPIIQLPRTRPISR